MIRRDLGWSLGSSRQVGKLASGGATVTPELMLEGMKERDEYEKLRGELYGRSGRRFGARIDLRYVVDGSQDCRAAHRLHDGRWTSRQHPASGHADTGIIAGFRAQVDCRYRRAVGARRVDACDTRGVRNGIDRQYSRLLLSCRCRCTWTLRGS